MTTTDRLRDIRRTLEARQAQGDTYRRAALIAWGGQAGSVQANLHMGLRIATSYRQAYDVIDAVLSREDA